MWRPVVFHSYLVDFLGFHLCRYMETVSLFPVRIVPLVHYRFWNDLANVTFSPLTSKSTAVKLWLSYDFSISIYFNLNLCHNHILSHHRATTWLPDDQSTWHPSKSSHPFSSKVDFLHTDINSTNCRIQLSLYGLELTELTSFFLTSEGLRLCIDLCISQSVSHVGAVLWGLRPRPSV